MNRKCIALFSFSLTLALANAASELDQLAQVFRAPSAQARPSAFWNWLNGDISLTGITRDLEEAKAKGMSGLEIWDCGALRNENQFIPSGPAFLGPESVAAIHHTIAEAKRLNMGLGMISSSGWNAGGTWVTPPIASKNLFEATTVIAGGKWIEIDLPFPEVPESCPMNPDGKPQWSLDVAVLAWPNDPDKIIADPSAIINLTENFKSGKLTWSAPPGNWHISRYVCSNNGQELIAASPNSIGLFIDFLDPSATRFHFETILQRLGFQKGTDPGPMKYLEVDSMELHPGIQWTSRFPEWFQKWNHYEPISWLPALHGWTIANKETSERFCYDYRKAVSDLLIWSHYKTGSEVCAEYGMHLVGEAGGPGPPVWDTCPVDSLKALGNVDVPRGEFWIQNRHNIFLIKEIASAAHIYGKPLVDAESWTTWRRWKDSPFERKIIVDRAFSEGLNRITYHVFPHSPPEAGFPGRAYHAGVDMNPQTVWWSKARPFMDYLSRCCEMLQKGLFVADVAYFYGDQAPNFWPMHHNVPAIPRIPGRGRGYDYDVVNSDVILNRMSVRDGRIVLPDGMSYNVLVLPEQNDIPLEVLTKIAQLARDGATILGPQPTRVPGLHHFQEQTKKLLDLASAMWANDQPGSKTITPYGHGRVVTGYTAEQWLKEQSITPDFSSQDDDPEQPLNAIHRKTGEIDIYFVSNPSRKSVDATCLFRVHDRVPHLWDPADGSTQGAKVFSQQASGISLPIQLAAGGSIFVIFEKPNTDSHHLTRKIESPASGDNATPAPEVIELSSNNALIRCWQEGNYQLHDSSGKIRQFSAKSLPEPIRMAEDWFVKFDPKWGAPAKLKWPKLISWTDHSDDGVKYYSGSAQYHKTLNLPINWHDASLRVLLDMGDVRELAEVFVNGKSAGICWKPPFQIEITSLVQSGTNELKIEVMNLWINRLVGDEQLPESKRFTKTNIRKGQDWTINPSGLLGPVRVIAGRDVHVKW